MRNGETASRSRLASLAAERPAAAGGAVERRDAPAAADRPAGDEQGGPPWLAATGREGRGASVLRYLPAQWRGARLTTSKAAGVALIAVGMVAAALAGFVVVQGTPQAVDVPALALAQTTTADAGEPTSTSAATTSGAAPGPPPEPSAIPSAAPTIVVSVVGLVHQSGLFTLPEGARIADALAAAAGAQPEADVLSLNLARPLQDGDQILVGRAPGPGEPQQLLSAVVSAGGAPPDRPSTRPGSAAPEGALVNLNTASAAELDVLPGVGPVTAGAIVAWREANGPFTAVEQLSEVDGIGPGRLDKLRPLVTV
jgi:competence protein ComEA